MSMLVPVAVPCPMTLPLCRICTSAPLLVLPTRKVMFVTLVTLSLSMFESDCANRSSVKSPANTLTFTIWLSQTSVVSEPFSARTPTKTSSGPTYPAGGVTVTKPVVLFTSNW